MNAVETNNLTFSRNGVSILKGIDLKVEEGSITGFLGPNGAGKTTTILLLLGLLESDRGSISLFGSPFHPNMASAGMMKRRIGYLAQKPSFHPWMSCREVLQFTGRLHYGRISRKLNEWIGDCLEMAGIYGLADRKCGTLSGGELQRLGLAQAWVSKPELLILDEPAASLDPAGRHAVLSMMRELQKESTIFFSTHILDDVERVSDRLIILNKGEVILNGSCEDISRSENKVELELELTGEKTGELREKIHQFLCKEPGIRIHRFGEKRKRLEELFLELTMGGDQEKEKNNEE